MNKKIRLDVTIFLIVAAVLVSVLATAFIINAKVSALTELQAAFAKIKNIEDVVEENFTGTVDSEALADSVAKGYVAGLNDPYCVYYSKEEYRAYQSALTGSYDGIGVTTEWLENTGLKVTYVSRNSPAATAGINIGDVITFIDDVSVLTLNEEEAMTKLTGTVGTVANITVLRGEETRVFSIVRSQYDPETVDYKVYGNIGYIRVTGFNASTAQDFDKAVSDIESAGVAGMIVDVRNNAGGGIDNVVACLDRLVAKGTVATSVRRNTQDPESKTVYEAVTAQKCDLPCVVLADKNTVYTAEVFVAALHDLGKATFIGETTFGKATGQTSYKLPDGSYVRITDFTYYPPSGNTFQLVGITPDQAVTLTAEQEQNRYTVGRADDPYILAAFEALGGDIGALGNKPIINPEVD